MEPLITQLGKNVAGNPRVFEVLCSEKNKDLKVHADDEEDSSDSNAKGVPKKCSL